MKMLVQYLVGCGVMLIAVQFLYGTPFHHWMVYTAIFIGSMYAVAVVQFRIHYRHSRRR